MADSEAATVGERAGVRAVEVMVEEARGAEAREEEEMGVVKVGVELEVEEMAEVGAREGGLVVEGRVEVARVGEREVPMVGMDTMDI